MANTLSHQTPIPQAPLVLQPCKKLKKQALAAAHIITLSYEGGGTIQTPIRRAGVIGKRNFSAGRGLRVLSVPPFAHAAAEVEKSPLYLGNPPLFVRGAQPLGMS